MTALTLTADHTAEVTETQDTDELVRSRIAQLIDELTVFGRTLGLDGEKHRYSELIDCIGDAVHDGFPAPRVLGDDPFI
jgi:hypothetical protein